MSWSKDTHRPNAPELLYTSRARDVNVLECDLWCVLYRMLQRKGADGADGGVGIFLATEVPDRSIVLRWVDAELQFVGAWTYSLNADALFQACLDSDDAADTFEDWVGSAVSWLAEDQEDLVNGEPVKEGHRPGLRPLHAHGGIHYAHPAYALPMSKTDPVDLYWRDPMTDEIELF